MPFPSVLIRKTLTRLLYAVHLAMGEPPVITMETFRMSSFLGVTEECCPLC